MGLIQEDKQECCMANQTPGVDIEYPKSHVVKIMGLDMLIFLIGVLLAVGPFVERKFPGDFDTTVHIAVGALVAVLAIFRVLVGYGSIWIDVCLIAFGVITAALPKIQHMLWNQQYSVAHWVAGGVIIVFSLIAMMLTIPVIKKIAR
jgi:hypothetical protein